MKVDNSTIITIANVKVSSDLKIAKIYISIYNNRNNEEENNQIFTKIKKEKKKIRYHLGLNIKTKYVPEIQLNQDDSFHKLNKIFKIK